MHIVTETPNPVTLIRYIVSYVAFVNGRELPTLVRSRSEVFASLDEFAAQARGWLLKALVSDATTPGFVLIDVDGRVLPPGLVTARRAALGIKDQSSWVRPHRFRDGPVPRTGRSRRGRYAILRHPQTLATLREAASCDPLEPKLRGRRGRNVIPSSWDDQFRHLERSWKRQRRTRWKPRQ